MYLGKSAERLGQTSRRCDVRRQWGRSWTRWTCQACVSLGVAGHNPFFADVGPGGEGVSGTGMVMTVVE